MASIFYIALGSKSARSCEDQDIKPPDTSDGLKTGAFQKTDFQAGQPSTGKIYDVYTIDQDHPYGRNITSYLTATFPKGFERSWPEGYRDDPDYAGLMNLYTEVQAPESLSITFPATQQTKDLLLEIFKNPEDPDSSPIQVLGEYKNDTSPLYKIRIEFNDEKKLSPFERYSLQKFLQVFEDQSEKEIAKEYGADILNLYYFAKGCVPVHEQKNFLVLSGPPAGKYFDDPSGTAYLSDIPPRWFDRYVQGYPFEDKKTLREILGENLYRYILNGGQRNDDQVHFADLAELAEIQGYKKGWWYEKLGPILVKNFKKLSQADREKIKKFLASFQKDTYYAEFTFADTHRVNVYLDSQTEYVELHIDPITGKPHLITSQEDCTGEFSEKSLLLQLRNQIPDHNFRKIFDQTFPYLWITIEEQ